MSLKASIFSDAWCNEIFANRNQAYGAFELRNASSKRHLIAVISAVVFFSLACTSPMILKSILPETKELNDKVVEVGKYNFDEPKNDVNPPIEIPEPEVLSTIGNSKPVISTEDDVTEAEQMLTQMDLLGSNKIIGGGTVFGTTDDPNETNNELLELHKEITNTTKEKPTIDFDEPAEFPGGEIERKIYLKDNIIYPSFAKEINVQGTVYVQFVVNRNGKISDVTLQRGIGSGCDEEAIRVVKKMPTWKPAKKDGQVVTAYFNMAIVYVLK
jgi:protein TonB